MDWVPRNAKRDVEGETRRKGDLEMKGEKAKRPLVMIFFSSAAKEWNIRAFRLPWIGQPCRKFFSEPIRNFLLNSNPPRFLS